MFPRSINPENPADKSTRRSLAVAGGVLGIMFMTTGCTMQEQAVELEQSPAPEVNEKVYIGESGSGLNISTEYYPNGTRRVYIKEPSAYGSSIFGFCEGGDLVEVATLYQGGGMERSIGHAACADNRLTQQDFTPLPQ